MLIDKRIDLQNRPPQYFQKNALIKFNSINKYNKNKFVNNWKNVW